VLLNTSTNTKKIRVYVKLTEMQTFFYKSFLTRDFEAAMKAHGNDAFMKLLFLVMQLRLVTHNSQVY
jgi:hypothetical protein